MTTQSKSTKREKHAARKRSQRMHGIITGAADFTADLWDITPVQVLADAGWMAVFYPDLRYRGFTAREARGAIGARMATAQAFLLNS